MGVFLSTNNGGKEDLPTKESVWSSILIKIGEVYSCLKAKLESLFQSFSESLWKGFEAVANFVKYCCETLKEGLSWIINEAKKLFRNKEGPVSDQEPSHNLSEMIKILVQNAREVVYQLFEVKDCSTQLKLNSFFDLAQGFGELLEYFLTSPWNLALVLLDAFIIYCCNKCGRVSNGGLITKKHAAMVVVSLLSYLL